MKLFNLSLAVAAAVLTSCMLPGCGSDSSRQPNVVFIMADDMGYGDVGAYNPESKIPTPNMDRLAAEGILFANAHAPAALCTPTRYGLLTGRYCWRTRLKSWVLADFYGDTPLIEEQRMTLASLFQQQGYETACIGKWHVGIAWQTIDGRQATYEDEAFIDFTQPIIGGPTERGFDYFYGTAGCSTSDPPYVFIENDKTVSIPTQMIPAHIDSLPGVVTGLMADDWSQELVDVRLTEKAIAFMERHQREQPDDPFFLYFVPSSPHIPWMVPDFMKGTTAGGPREELVALVDWCVGQITETLKRLGIEEQTWLFVTSDNGPRPVRNGHRSAGHLRGYKAQIWEGGHRVPFIVSWPGQIQPGVSEEILSLTDMMATFAEYFGVELPDHTAEDSYSVLPALFGNPVPGNSDRHRVFHSGNGVFAIQQGDWKLIQGTKGSGSGRDQVDPDSLLLTGQLYYLADDPGEKQDLWDQYPDKVSELNTILEQIK